MLKDDVDRPLAAILTLNTIANTAGAAAIGCPCGAAGASGWLRRRGVMGGLSVRGAGCGEPHPGS